MVCRMCSYDAHSQCRDVECPCTFPLHIGRPDFPRPAALGPAPAPPAPRPRPVPALPVPAPVPPPAATAVAVLDPPAPIEPAPAPDPGPEATPRRPRRPSTSTRRPRRPRPPAPVVALAPATFAPVPGPGTVNVTLTRPAPTIGQPSWTVPPPKPTYRSGQDPKRRVWPGRIHPRLRQAREQRQQWHALMETADRLLAANRWNPASKHLVAAVLGEELAGWVNPPA